MIAGDFLLQSNTNKSFYNLVLYIQCNYNYVYRMICTNYLFVTKETIILSGMKIYSDIVYL